MLAFLKSVETVSSTKLQSLGLYSHIGTQTF